MRFPVSAAVLAVCLCSAGSSPAFAARTIFVAPSGRDSASGSRSAPLRSPAAAVDRLGAIGGRVALRPGRYPTVVLNRRLAHRVELSGAARTGAGPRAELAGLILAGATNVDVGDVRVTGPLTVTSQPVRRTHAARIEVTRTEVTNPHGPCLTVRGATDVEIDHSWIHDCRFGAKVFGGASDVRVLANRIERVEGDGIDIDDVLRLTIDQNRIAYLSDPAKFIHNDAIQVFGSAREVAITRNVMHDSRTQLMMVQAHSGPNDGLRIVDNLMYNAAACGLQVSGTRRLAFVNNTVWNTAFSGLLLRTSSSGVQMGDAVVANNLLSQLSMTVGVQATRFSANVVSVATRTMPAGTLVDPEPGFVDPAAGDYQLSDGSPVRGTGDASMSPASDLAGASRAPAPSVGAFQ